MDICEITMHAVWTFCKITILCGHLQSYHTVGTFAKCLVLCKTNVYLIYFYLRAVEVFSSLKIVLIKKSSRNINAHKNNIVDSLFYFIINNCTKLFSCKRPSVFEPLLFGKIISFKKELNETWWRRTSWSSFALLLPEGWGSILRVDKKSNNPLNHGRYLKMLLLQKFSSKDLIDI